MNDVVPNDCTFYSVFIGASRYIIYLSTVNINNINHHIIAIMYLVV